MKHCILFSIWISLAIKSTAQLDKKNLLIGGSGSISSSIVNYTSTANNFKEKNSQIEISPSFGYFLVDKFAMGLKSTFYSLNTKITEPLNGGKTNYKRFTVGPFARYYLLDIDKQFNILTQLSYQSGILSQRGALKENGKINEFSFLAGPEVFFNSSVGLEVLLGYKMSTEKLVNSQSPFKDERRGLQVSIGFQYHLEKH